MCNHAVRCCGNWYCMQHQFSFRRNATAKIKKIFFFCLVLRRNANAHCCLIRCVLVHRLNCVDSGFEHRSIAGIYPAVPYDYAQRQRRCDDVKVAHIVFVRMSDTRISCAQRFLPFAPFKGHVWESASAFVFVYRYVHTQLTSVWRWGKPVSVKLSLTVCTMTRFSAQRSLPIHFHQKKLITRVWFCLCATLSTSLRSDSHFCVLLLYNVHCTVYTLHIFTRHNLH